MSVGAPSLPQPAEYASIVGGMAMVYFPRVTLTKEEPLLSKITPTSCSPILDPEKIWQKEHEERSGKIRAALVSSLPQVLIDLCISFFKLPTPLCYLHRGKGGGVPNGVGVECQSFALEDFDDPRLALPLVPIPRKIRIVKKRRREVMNLEWAPNPRSSPSLGSQWQLSSRVRWQDGEETLDLTGRVFEKNGRWNHTQKTTTWSDSCTNNPSPLHSFTLALFPRVNVATLQGMQVKKGPLPEKLFTMWCVTTYLVLPDHATEQEMLQAYEDALLKPPPKIPTSSIDQLAMRCSNYWRSRLSAVLSKFGIGSA
jgi:hypothetical protein